MPLVEVQIPPSIVRATDTMHQLTLLQRRYNQIPLNALSPFHIMLPTKCSKWIYWLLMVGFALNRWQRGWKQLQAYGRTGIGGQRVTFCWMALISLHLELELQLAMLVLQAWVPSLLPWLDQWLLMQVLFHAARDAYANTLWSINFGQNTPFNFCFFF